MVTLPTSRPTRNHYRHLASLRWPAAVCCPAGSKGRSGGVSCENLVGLGKSRQLGFMDPLGWGFGRSGITLQHSGRLARQAMLSRCAPSGSWTGWTCSLTRQAAVLATRYAPPTLAPVHAETRHPCWPRRGVGHEEEFPRRHRAPGGRPWYPAAPPRGGEDLRRDLSCGNLSWPPGPVLRAVWMNCGPAACDRWDHPRATQHALEGYFAAPPSRSRDHVPP